MLYLSMLANAMWYGTVEESPSGGGLKFGPFNMTPEQVFGAGVTGKFI